MAKINTPIWKGAKGRHTEVTEMWHFKNSALQMIGGPMLRVKNILDQALVFSLAVMPLSTVLYGSWTCSLEVFPRRIFKIYICPL